MAVTEEQRKESMKNSTIIISVVIGILTAYICSYTFSLMRNDGVQFFEGIINVFLNISGGRILFAPCLNSFFGVLIGLTVGGVGYLFMSMDNERNYSYKKGEEAGTSRFMTRKELKQYSDEFISPDPPAIKEGLPVKYDPEKDADKYSKNIIMSNSFCRPLNDMRRIGNNNILVVGGAGTGKSRFFIKPNLLQMNASYIITDPSGEMITNLGKTLKDHGYKIKIFNISDMQHSNCYNPVHYIRDEAGVDMLIECLINNTQKGEGGGDNQFFVDAEKLLYSACLYYLIDFCHDDSKKNLASVMDMINASQVNEMNPNAKSDLDELFDCLPKNSLAWKQYHAFKQAAGKTLKSIIISCVVRLRVFMTPQVANLTKSDDLHLERIGDEKTALFIITPQADRTYAFLASILYSQLFETLYYKGEQKMVERGTARMTIPVRCMMDEFANIGEVPEFPSKLATMRKYNISAAIVLQDIAQIEAMYEDNWKTLVGNCSTRIFLGSSEPNTLKYFSEMLGESTIRTKSESRNYSSKGGSSKSFQQTGRAVMTPDELGRMPSNECIVFTQNEFSVRDKKYIYENHPYYDQTADAKRDNSFKYTEISIYNNGLRGNVDSLIKAKSEMQRIRNKRNGMNGEAAKRALVLRGKQHKFVNAKDVKLDGSMAEETNKISFGDDVEKEAYRKAVQECLYKCASDPTASKGVCILYVEDIPSKYLKDITMQLTQTLKRKAVIIFSNITVNDSDTTIAGVGYAAPKSEINLEKFMRTELTERILNNGSHCVTTIHSEQFKEYKNLLFQKLS